ncbi:hypothetical protein [Massilia sp. NP310]|uniref:hypothetical protein n=1 Tax=Massilia sp. NP310 TaxID=2861282 RepID=UPI001C6311D5|nr:hypothetical protein [Massilia sp. NP310]QYG04007.1 hypothetical protein KY496_11815 [Massilia sp. NP310]
MATPDQLQSQSIAWASNLVDRAQALTDSAQEAINNIDSGKIDYSIPLAQAFKEPDQIESPELHSVAFEIPAEPVKPGDIQQISPLVIGDLPTFGVVAPTLTLPSRPAELGAFTTAPPQLNIDAKFPTPPAALESPNFEAPTIGSYAMPVRPDISLPTFDEVAPSGDLPVLGDVSSKFVATYREQAPAMMSAIESKMDSFVAKYNPQYHAQLSMIEGQLAKYFSGGTALKPEVENAIYERSRDKISSEYLRNIAAVDADGARRGFTIPTVAMNAARLQLRVNAGDNLARSSIEIATDQAQREQANLQFAVTASSQMRTTMLQAALTKESNMIQVNSAAIDMSRIAVDMIIEGYNAELEGFKFRLGRYQAIASVLETKLRMALAGVEVYKADIDALEALTNVDRAKVEIYTAQLEGLQTQANVYKTQVDAVVAKADLEKLKLEIFQTEAQVYATQAQAKNAEWSGYSAAIQGEQAKIAIFDSQARAYQTELAGFQAKIDAQTAQLDAEIRRNEAISQQYAADISAFTSIVSARGEVARNDLANQSLAVQAFQVKAAAAVAEAQSRASYYTSVNQVGIEQARLFTQQSLDRGRLMLEKTKAIAEGTTSLGRTVEGAASAAMSGVVSLAATTVNTSS